MTIDTNRFTLAFYGLDTSPLAMKSYYHIASDWISNMEYTPNKMSVTYGEKQGKVGNYQRINSRLTKQGFEHVTCIAIYVSLPNAFVPAMEYIVATTMAFHAIPTGYAVIALPSSRVTRNSWLPHALRLVHSLKPHYGIGYCRELEYGPVMYALGICQGGPVVTTGELYEKERHISRWCDMGMPQQVYRRGLLRDVYPINFLTEPQLTRQTHGKTLLEWIREKPERGTLADVGGGMLLWEVEPSNIPQVQHMLHLADGIFDWRKHAT